MFMHANCRLMISLRRYVFVGLFLIREEDVERRSLHMCMWVTRHILMNCVLRLFIVHIVLCGYVYRR